VFRAHPEGVYGFPLPDRRRDFSPLVRPFDCLPEKGEGAFPVAREWRSNFSLDEDQADFFTPPDRQTFAVFRSFLLEG